MEPLELLGGKYMQANQILPGTLQTFRAVDSASGRDVFVHRVPASDPTAHQLALLLSSALIKSAKVRRMVLDVIEAEGFAYVVTDTEHQCLLLREWLQFEIDLAGGSSSAPPKPSALPEAKPNAAPSPQAAVTSEPKQDPGEFTRMFMAGDSLSAPAPAAKSPVGEETQLATPAAKAPIDKPELAPENPKQQSGEFTRMFMAGTAPSQGNPTSQPDPTSQPNPTAPEKNSPRESPPAGPQEGEFTRFFQGPNRSEPKLPAQESPRNSERFPGPDLGRTGFVQRPSSPLPAAPSAPPAPKPTEPGEFTRMFRQGSLPASESASSSVRPPRVEPGHDPFAKQADADMFGPREPVSALPPTPAKSMGEYTRIFGSGSEAPSPQQASGLAAPPPPVSDDPLFTNPGPAQTPPPPVRSAGPSEYTLVMTGQRSETTPADSPAGAATPQAGGAPSGMPLPQVKFNVAPPALPLQGLHVPPPPSMGGGGGVSASAGSAGMGSASAHVAGPQMPAAAPPPMSFPKPAMKAPAVPAGAALSQKNTKLIILFAVLGVLALLLVVLIVLLLKK